MYAIITVISICTSAIGFMVVAFVRTNMQNAQRAIEGLAIKRPEWLPH